MATVARASRRTAELGLIVLAGIITAGAYALAGLGKTASLPANLAPLLLIILGLLAAAHIATRRLAPNADGVLLPMAGLLNGIGYVFIARLDPDLAGLQALWTGVGVAAFIATLLVVRRARDLERYRYTFALAGVALLLLPLLPGLGRNINGSRIWIRVGTATFQPGEVAKIVLAIFFAGYLVEKRELLQAFTRRLGPVNLPDPKFLGPVLGAWGFSLVVMIFERDLGSALLFFALFVSMLWVATARGIYLVLGFLLFSVGCVIAFTAFGHVRSRVDIWLHAFADADDRGYQLVQGLFAFGSGGVAGTGLSLGSPGKIPYVTTDFIFAAIGEELGLLGTTAILVAFLIMVGTALRIALQARSDFERLLATGLAVILGIQTFIILGGVTRLVPLTGITLPFVSYGGSSLLANYVLLALLLRISSEPATSRAGAVNRQIRILGITLMVLFGALFLQLNYLQVIRADELANDPRNTRVAVRDFSRPRGQIISADGTVLARSIPVDDAFELLRQYPEGELFGYVTGFFSFTYGSTGIERTYSDELAGRDLGIRNIKDLLVDRTVTGDIVLSIDKGLQQLARDRLGDKRGSVVALDPATGAVLALWSFPSADPSPLAAHDQKAVRAAFDQLTADPSKPLLARSYRETYPPGSTFKVITAAAALERQPELATKVYPVLRELDLPGTSANLPNFGGGACGGPLPDLLRVSCNTGFGQMGIDLGAGALSGEADDWGFNDQPPIDLPAAAASGFPAAEKFKNDEANLAKSAIGQQDVRTTPLQMALIAAGVANGGTVMGPTVMREVRDSNGNVVRTQQPKAWKQAVSAPVAGQMKDLMINVVTSGTGRAASVAGAVVGGKTGTAQTVGDNAHAWFIGFGEGNGRKVAVSVIVESQPEVSEATGGRVAAPIAGDVIKAALGL